MGFTDPHTPATAFLRIPRQSFFASSRFTNIVPYSIQQLLHCAQEPRTIGHLLGVPEPRSFIWDYEEYTCVSCWV
jgi:hypothetical protein